MAPHNPPKQELAHLEWLGARKDREGRGGACNQSPGGLREERSVGTCVAYAHPAPHFDATGCVSQESSSRIAQIREKAAIAKLKDTPGDGSSLIKFGSSHDVSKEPEVAAAIEQRGSADGKHHLTTYEKKVLKKRPVPKWKEEVDGGEQALVLKSKPEEKHMNFFEDATKEAQDTYRDEARKVGRCPQLLPNARTPRHRFRRLH